MNKDIDMNKLIDHISGSSDELETLCQDFGFSAEDLTIEQLREIDECVFQCPGCGWWCDRAEGHNIDGEDFCEDCYEEDMMPRLKN